MLRALSLALAGLALAALLALGVFFASEAALLGDEESPLAPREPALTASTTLDGTTTTAPTTTATAPDTPTSNVPTLTETDGDGGGQERGRGRGRGGDSGNSGPGGDDD